MVENRGWTKVLFWWTKTNFIAGDSSRSTPVDGAKEGATAAAATPVEGSRLLSVLTIGRQRARRTPPPRHWPTADAGPSPGAC